MRVYIGPVEISGYYANLTFGLKQIGIDCDFITFNAHPFNYGGETKPPFLILLSRTLTSYSQQKLFPVFIRQIIFNLGVFLRVMWSLWAILYYDVFIFGFGTSLFPKNYDLTLLKLLNKKIIINFAHGSEARPPYLDGCLQSKSGVSVPLDYLVFRSQWLKKRLNFCSQQTEYIIGAPFSTSHFCQSSFINWFAVGFPISIDRYRYLIEKPNSDYNLSTESNEPVRILHCPSHPISKGSSQIYQAINSLISKGYLINFTVLEGRPHEEVLNELNKCDFVVDQIFSDTPMPTFAAEAALLGKPTVIGGYRLEYLKTLIGERLWPPSQTCHPDDVEKSIELMISDVPRRRELGISAQKFVLENYTPQKVASNYLQIINGQIPNSWWIDPSKILYVEGCGQSHTTTQTIIRNLVNEYGIKSLQISHNNALETALMTIAFGQITRES